MTERLYYDQTYLREFDAEVEACEQREDGVWLLLDRSAFYPTSGGQPFDTGRLRWWGGQARVTDVECDARGVWHKLEGECPERGTAVHGEIDWARRFDHMQQHGGEHMLAGAIWGAIPGLLKALLNINEVIASIMTNWIAANLVTWLFDISNLKNVTENTKSGYIYKTTFNGVATAKMGLDQLFPGSQVNGGILVAIALAVIVYVILSRTTFGYELKACGANRFAARYAGIKDKRNIVLSMAIAGALAGAGAALYYLSGNTEFFWSTYQSLPGVGFNGIPVALLAANHPIGVIFTGLFMSALDLAGLQLTNLTAYNEYITDVIIAVIVYLSAFSLVIRMWLGGKRRKQPAAEPDKTETGKEAKGA